MERNFCYSVIMKGLFQRSLRSFPAVSALVCPLLLMSALPSFSADLPDVTTSISFDSGGALMKGSTVISVHRDGETVIHTGLLQIRSLRLNGSFLEPVIKDGTLKVKTTRGSAIEIEFQCASDKDGPCVINERGMFLTNTWYPSPEGLFTHRLSALVPKDFTALSEAETIVVDERAEGKLFSFFFPHPVNGVNFIAGRYAVRTDIHNGIELYAYFFPEDIGLADTYIEYTKKYLSLYEGMIGKFPFKRFSVVENFLQTGYSMPTYTLLGQDVVRLPFIVKTSLGHEILHQWFGNLVYIDYEKGNWAEGLTTYLSDHLYEEQEGRGWQYRKQIMTDYDSYVSPEEEITLRDFRTRTDFASRAVGYGKGAMVFHMLRGLVGEDLFYRSLRELVETKQFQEASWGDIETAFEKIAGMELGWFFKQWVDGKGSPLFEVMDTTRGPKGLHSLVSFDIIQKGQKYSLDVPVSVKAERGETGQILKVRDTRQSFEISVDGNPERLAIDENYDLFRSLSKDETPPVIAKILSEQEGLLALPVEGKDDLYRGAVEFFKGRGYAAKRLKEIKDEDIKTASVVVLDHENPLLKRLFGKTDAPSNGLSITVRKNPLNTSKVIAIVDTDSRDEVEASLGKITHFGKYSLLLFREGRNSEKKIAESDRGWSIPLKENVTGFQVATALTLNDIIEKVSGKRIVYVGEEHDRYEDHMAELELIRGLFKKNPRIAIGMEMFQRPFQKALDDYIEGSIEEPEFLKSSEYFKRWGFDYNHYKNILRFARDEKIPVIALNIRQEIVSKVSRSGIDSLTEDEKKELPDAMDMTDEAYRERLRAIFERHEGAESKNFDNFYQSQVIWDEIMSQSIDDYLKKNPDRQIVVIAGGGHLAFGSGIPRRTFRRNGLDYALTLNDTSGEPGIADFVLFPKSLDIVHAPKLMALLKEEDTRVKITAFPEKSVSEKAGLRSGDTILSLDGKKITSVDDIQIFLFYKKTGETIKVKVLRRRFIFGEQEREFDVTL